MTDSNSSDLFASLFDRPRRETCYGYVTAEEYERRASIDRAKAEARLACTLCGGTGYRNMYVCHHGEPSGAQAAKRRVQKKRMRLIPGGDA